MRNLGKKLPLGNGKKTARLNLPTGRFIIYIMEPMSINTIDPALLAILVCPVTKSPLKYEKEAQELVSEKAGLAYPIRDGIPIMLPEEARKLHTP